MPQKTMLSGVPVFVNFQDFSENKKGTKKIDKKPDQPILSQEEKYRRRVFLLEDTRTRLYK